MSKNNQGLNAKELSEVYVYREEKARIIESFNHIFNSFKEKYPEEFLLRILLDSDYSSAIQNRLLDLKRLQKIPSYELLNKDKVLLELKEKRDQKSKLIRLLYNIVKEQDKYTFNHILKLFNIVIDLRDFVLGGTLYDIEKKNEIRNHFLKTIAVLVFPDKVQYKRRLFHNRYLAEEILKIANNVITGKIVDSNFSNLTSPYIQELFNLYRKKNYKKPGESLFNRIFLECDFTRRIYNMSHSKLEHIFADFNEKISRNEILIMCAKINKNLEILQYIIYNLIKTNQNFETISKISGKSINFIKKCQVLLLLNDYTRRFVRDKNIVNT